jgi:hypothetical protein
MGSVSGAGAGGGAASLAELEGIVEDVIDETLPDLVDGRGIKINTATTGQSKPELFIHNLGANSFAPVASTTAETSLLASPFAVAAGDWTVDDYFEFYASGYLTNNSGGDRTFTFKLKLGSQAVYTVVTPALTTNAGTRAWTFDGRFSWVDFIGTRPMGCVNFTLSAAGQTGYDSGNITRVPDPNLYVLTSAFNVDFTVQMSSTAHANLNVTCQNAYLQRKDK